MISEIQLQIPNSLLQIKGNSFQMVGNSVTHSNHHHHPAKVILGFTQEYTFLKFENVTVCLNLVNWVNNCLKMYQNELFS